MTVTADSSGLRRICSTSREAVHLRHVHIRHHQLVGLSGSAQAETNSDKACLPPSAHVVCAPQRFNIPSRMRRLVRWSSTTRILMPFNACSGTLSPDSGRLSRTFSRAVK